LDQEQIEFLKRIAETFDRLGVPYAVVGSWACMAYGEARFTRDIDLVSGLSDARLREFLASFPAGEFYHDEVGIRDSLRQRIPFNIIHPSTGQKADFMMPRPDAWGLASMLRRRSIAIFPDCSVSFAAPEDVIVGKLWYHDEGGSDKHLRDIAGMLRVSGDDIDRADVEKWAVHFGYVETWHRILAAVDAG
jgi:hypothetical protein